MLRYHFSVFFYGGCYHDETGDMLPDNDAAIAHAKKVVLELSQHGAYCEGHTIRVMQGGRLVALIPFGEESKLAEH
jgi:hypothetical protein